MNMGRTYQNTGNIPTYAIPVQIKQNGLQHQQYQPAKVSRSPTYLSHWVYQYDLHNSYLFIYLLALFPTYIFLNLIIPICVLKLLKNDNAISLLMGH